MEPQDEQDLIERCRGGDRRAFAELVDLYKVLVFNLVDRTIGDKALGEDLAQEVFIRVYQGLPGFRGEARLSTWIYRIAYNVCAAELERARYRMEFVSIDAKGDEEGPGLDLRDDRQDPEAILSRIDFRSTIQRLLDRLPPRSKAMLTLYYLQELSYEEIGAVMALPAWDGEDPPAPRQAGLEGYDRGGRAMEGNDRRIPHGSGDTLSCEVCRALILDYVEGALHVEVVRQVEAHIAGCPVCRLELALAQTIERALSSQELRMPPADFTARVLSALPAVQTVGQSFWSQMLQPMAYAVSILALILGLSPYIPDLSRLAGAWSDRLSMLPRILGIGWIAPFVPPGRLGAFFRATAEAVGDALSSMTVMSEQLQGLYSANAPAVHLTMAALALLWVVYNDRQEAKE